MNEKLRSKMLRSPNGWSGRDVVKLLSSYGFVDVEGAEHTNCYHEVYRNLRLSVPRHKTVKPFYVREALRLVDEVVSYNQ